MGQISRRNAHIYYQVYPKYLTKEINTYSMSKHLEIFQERVKRDVSIFYRKGDKIDKFTDCRLLHLDKEGVTFEDKVKLGKNRIKFIAAYSLVMIEQEFV